MEKSIISTPKAPDAIGPYSQGWIAGSMALHLRPGACGPRQRGDSLRYHRPGREKLQNVAAVLEAGGAALQDVIKTTCFLADMEDFAAFNEVYARYFTSKPARSCVAVRELPKGALCEIEAIAIRRNSVS